MENAKHGPAAGAPSRWRGFAVPVLILVTLASCDAPGESGSQATGATSSATPRASQPAGTAAATTTSTASATPWPPPMTYPEPVYVWRDVLGLPPRLKYAPGADPRSPIEERIRARVEALNNAVSNLSETVLLADPKHFYVKSVKVNGDTATIDYSARFPAAGAGFDGGLVAQIVYTATEEPTILRVLVTETEGR